MVKLYNSNGISDLLPNVKEKVKSQQGKPIVLQVEEKKGKPSTKKGFANEKEIFLYNKKQMDEAPAEKKHEAANTVAAPELAPVAVKEYKPGGRKPGQKDVVKRKSRYGGKMTEKQLETLAKARAKSVEVRKQRKLAMEAAKAKAVAEHAKVATAPTPAVASKPVNIPPPRRRVSRQEVETDFFNLMDRYYQKRDGVKATRKKQAADTEARKRETAEAEKKAAAIKPKTSYFLRKKPERNWDDFFY
jgi:hypothetical protein